MGNIHDAFRSNRPNKNVFSDCLKRLYDKSGCLRSVGRFFQSRGPAAMKAQSTKLVRVRLTSSVRVSAERRFSLTGVGDEAAVVSQAAGSMSRQRLADQGGDLKLDALPHWKPVQLAQNWRDEVASPSARHQHQPSGSVFDRLEATHISDLRRDFDRSGWVWFGLVRKRSEFDSSGPVNRKRVYGSVCDQSEPSS